MFMINIKKEWRWMGSDDELLEQGIDDYISPPKTSETVED